MALSSMVKNETTSAEVVKDAGLRAWIQTATDQDCDVIVEAALPPRQVTFQRQASGDMLSTVRAGSGDPHPARDLPL